MSIVAAYILPHPPVAVHEVGGGREAEIADTLAGFEYVAGRIAEAAPQTILIISPHTAYYSDWIHLAAGSGADGNLAQFGAPEVHIHLDYDIEFRERLEEVAQAAGIPAGCTSSNTKPLDHGMIVPLYFLDKIYPPSEYKAVSIGGSALPEEKLLKFGECLADVAFKSDRRCVLLVSGDLSHKLKDDGPYGYHPAGPEFQDAFERVVVGGDALGFAGLDRQMCEDAAECGLSGFVMMAGALERQKELSGAPYTSELISLEGPFGVGYGVAAFEFADALPGSVAEEVQQESGGIDALVALAEKTVDMYVKEGALPKAVPLSEDEPARAGCFVSIHLADSGDLRGCIGTIEPTQPTLAQEIIRNAVAAATEDPRFNPVSVAELGNLSINVDVLQTPERTTADKLDPKEYGVIVTQGHRRGLLLPDLDGVDTVEQQLRIACMKAGIEPSTDYGDIQIERFKVVRHA